MNYAIAYAIAYGIGWLIASTLAATYMIRERGNPDATDDALIATLACLIALFWPLALPIAIIWRSSSWWASALDRADQAVADRELDRRERAARIAQLERELGIGGDQ